MPNLSYSVGVPAPASALFDWHERPGAFRRLSPPWQSVTLERSDGIHNGDRAVIRLGVGPASILWVAEHRAYSDACRRGVGACQFQDIQVRGPFGSWSHLHRMEPEGPDASRLHDEITYTLPFAPVSSVVGGWVAEGQLDRMFAYRHRVTSEDLRRHQAAGLEPMTVAISGSSGMIGEALAAFLTTGGHRVVRLVRSRRAVGEWTRGPQERAVYWNVEAGVVDTDALAREAPDAVVHLAGEPVYALRYTTEKKRAIWESRTKGTQLLSRALAALPVPPRVLVSASASGIYGDRGAEAVDESSALGDGFLADVCKAWEASTAEAEAAGIRTVHARIGLVLSPAGGLLGKLAPAARLGLGGWPGDGSSYWAWIGLDDTVYALHHLLNSELSGPVDLSAPTPRTARDVVTRLGDVLGRPTLGRAPARLLRAVGGEAADEIVLKSTRMLPRRLLADGFAFSYPDLDDALGHVLGTTPLPASP